jgi:hypothetical protein
MIIISLLLWSAVKKQPESFYVILRRSGTKKKGRYSPLAGYIPKKEEINRFGNCSNSLNAKSAPGLNDRFLGQMNQIYCRPNLCLTYSQVC